MLLSDIENRVPVLLPSERDAARTAALLAEAGVRCTVCAAMPDLCRAISEGAGAALLTEHDLHGQHAALLADTLREQPPWSALPLVVLTSDVRERYPALPGAAVNVTLVEKPVRVRTLISVVQSALRARRHQYDIRDSFFERERQAAALRESEARFRTLVEQVKDYAIFGTDPHGRVQTWNEGVRRVLGYTEPEFRGLPVEALFTPEDRAAGVPAAEFAHAAANDTAGNDRWMLRKDGSRFFATGVTAALRNAAGELVGFTKVMRDQTDWKLAQDELARHRDRLDALVRERTQELEQSIQRLRASERMAAIGTLSAGLGHDMGNLLLPVRLRVDALADSNLPPDLHDDVQAIRTATEYLQRLANGLRLLAQDPDRSGNHPATELGSWWLDAQSVLRNALPRGVTLESRLPDAPCWIRVNRAALTQAVFNLVQNAGDALKGRTGGAVRVWAEPREGWVQVGVSDDGPGMTEEIRRRCLEPFFTTKTRGISTGLGLALVYGIVQDAGGTIDVHSAPGEGATFLLQFPLAEPERTHQPPDAERRTAVVDIADQRLRSFIEAELRSLAFQVLPPGDGEPRPRLWITDERSGAAPPAGVATVLLGPAGCAGPGVPHGARPSVSVIREALRRATAAAAAPLP